VRCGWVRRYIVELPIGGELFDRLPASVCEGVLIRVKPVLFTQAPPPHAHSEAERALWTTLLGRRCSAVQGIDEQQSIANQVPFPRRTPPPLIRCPHRHSLALTWLPPLPRPSPGRDPRPYLPELCPGGEGGTRAGGQRAQAPGCDQPRVARAAPDVRLLAHAHAAPPVPYAQSIRAARARRAAQARPKASSALLRVRADYAIASLHCRSALLAAATMSTSAHG
jgi:hypothetical protein